MSRTQLHHSGVLLTLALFGLIMPYPGTTDVQKAHAQEISSTSAKKKKKTHDWNAKTIHWRTYKEGIKEAKRTKKPILLLRHATWCGDCKVFAKAFHDDKIAKLSKKFVMILVDVDEEEIPDAPLKDTPNYIPHLTFLTPDLKLLSLTAQDSGESDAAYFYGKDFEVLRQNMEVALAHQQGDKVLRTLSLPFDSDEWFSSLYGDSMALPECPTAWRYITAPRVSFFCASGMTNEPLIPRGLHTLVTINDDHTLRYVMSIVEYKDQEDIDAAEVMHSRAIATIKKDESCKVKDFTVPKTLPEHARKDLKRVLTHYVCDAQHISVLYDPKNSLAIALAQDDAFIDMFIEATHLRYGVKPKMNQTKEK